MSRLYGGLLNSDREIAETTVYKLITFYNAGQNLQLHRASVIDHCKNHSNGVERC